MQSKLRPISFSLMGVIILLLISGSVVEQICGTAVAVRYVYTAPWTIALWAAAVVTAVWYMLTVRVYKQVITCLLHFSFVVILTGALLTHCFAERGTLHLRMDGTPAETENISLPFEVALTDFEVDYYEGTTAPMDFCSHLVLTDGEKQTAGEVRMNHVLRYRNYRFYQSRYDSDLRGTVLTVSHDPWGIGVTYAGYLLLLFSLVAFFFSERTRFRQLLRSPLLRGAAVVCLLLSVALPAEAKKQAPPTVSREVAKEMGNLYVYYNDRVCPLSTLANDFVVKLYGKPAYKGLSAEEVLCGWLFYYEKWADEPCIKIKGSDTRRTLGINGRYACLNDYVGGGRYKLEKALAEQDRNAMAADEKFRLVSMVCTATMLRIYPVVNLQDTVQQQTPVWCSWADRLPAYATQQQWQFVHRSMDYVFLCVARNASTEAADALRKIRSWQIEQMGTAAPSADRFYAEKTYYRINLTRPIAMAFATIGIVLFVVCCLLLSKNRPLARNVHFALLVLMLLLFVYLTLMLVLRYMASGHVPLSNGHETMQFLAWIASMLTAVGSARSLWQSRQQEQPAGVGQLLLPFGYLISGMTLMVSMMSQANPQITNLMPVLQSPLLTLHVAVIMIAYCLLLFVMLNSIAALLLPRQRLQLQVINQILLYPAVFCLAIGIFLGAVWANVSWGRYWGWDPKEVWALVTMLVYAAGLHTTSLRFLKRPVVFHVYCIVAFLFVLFTYFGVNFVLGGLHSYA